MNEIRVLDKGFVSLIEHMGDDRGVVQAARVSYRSDGLKTAEEDRKLVRYLIEHQHGSPFEHAVLKFHIKAPIFVARQWFRHRMASYNEVSGRYTEMKDEFYIPEKWRAQDSKNKQGSVDSSDLPHYFWTSNLARFCGEAMGAYRTMVQLGCSREMARILLPVNLYTEWYWTVNARALMHFIALRSEAHAQWEMRQYSNALYRLWGPIMPWTAEAFLGTLNLQKYASTDGIPGPSLEAING